MTAQLLAPARSARSEAEGSATTCTRCPVCGSEECLVLEELGNYCATMTAASLAAEREAPDGER